MLLSYVVSIVSLQLVTNLYNLTDDAVKKQGIAAEKQGGGVKKQEGKRVWVCEICKKELTSRSGYYHHVKTHGKSVVHQCDVCDKVLSSQSALIRHKKIHSGVKDYKCRTCGETFYRKDHLDGHQLKHTDVKLYKCTMCYNDRYFKTERVLKEHVKYHYPPKYSCKICDRKFHTSSCLSNHRKSHRDEKPFKCLVCSDQRFKTKGQLKMHMSYHSDRKWKCEKCKRKFYSSTHLKTHKVTCNY